MLRDVTIEIGVGVNDAAVHLNEDRTAAVYAELVEG
jgi:hypothetical protein